jgi:hypothetical protein
VQLFLNIAFAKQNQIYFRHKNVSLPHTHLLRSLHFGRILRTLDKGVPLRTRTHHARHEFTGSREYKSFLHFCLCPARPPARCTLSRVPTLMRLTELEPGYYNSFFFFTVVVYKALAHTSGHGKLNVLKFSMIWGSTKTADVPRRRK